MAVVALCLFSRSALSELVPDLNANICHMSSFLLGLVVMYGAGSITAGWLVRSLYSPVVVITRCSSLRS